jgi:hypothetical protein
VRAFSPLINIFLTCVAAVAVVPVLGLPWFGAAVDSNDGNQGQVELIGEAFARWFSNEGATATGTDTLTWAKTALLAVVAASALLALSMLVAPLRGQMRGLVKALPLAAPVIVLAGIISEANAVGVEPRYGSFAALALTGLLASAANQAGEMRESKPAQTTYTPGPGRAF